MQDLEIIIKLDPIHDGMGSLYGCMSFLSIDASDISDRMLADFLGMESRT